VNCTAPGVVSATVEVAAAAGKPLVGYPNSGETWDADARRWTGAPGVLPDDVSAWSAAGARLVGGCCRVRPDDIAAIAAMIR
jgi:S-methylmethionine-dependent homocysteine/selenocysteine methylase